MAVRGATWCDDEVTALLEIWSSEVIQALKKKYKEIIDKLRQSGVGIDLDEDVKVWHKWFELLH